VTDLFSQESEVAKGSTEVRAIRIPKSVGKIIEEEARSREVSVNALIVTVLKKFAEFDRYSEKFEYVTLARETFRLLIQELDDKGVRRAGTKAGKTVPREIAQFWFKDLDVTAFFSFLSNLARYSHLTQYDVKFEGGTYKVALRHNLGVQWSKFLEYYLGEAVGAILKTGATAEHSRNLVLLQFSLPDGRGPKTSV
jgi:hypothetical protein